MLFCVSIGELVLELNIKKEFFEDENKCVKNFATDLWDIRLYSRIGM